jgi:hypothetical protein
MTEMEFKDSTNERAVSGQKTNRKLAMEEKPEALGAFTSPP